MLKLLIVGDTHIPTRAKSIPEIMLKIIDENKPYDYVFFTGDLVSESVLEFFKKLGSKAFFVRGNMDYLSLPEYVVEEVNNIKMGLIHGDQVYPRGDVEGLLRIARNLKVNVLINGHTHYLRIIAVDNVLLVNPGSLTGVWSGGYASMRPSMIIGYVEEPGKIRLVSYEVYGKKLKREESIFHLKELT
ncbi:MAG: YfcE family phosphodiesterase [Thermoprotei archaeon]|nr:YfcE family phosphodiesterase [Thermoprotei archaeon]